MNNGRLVTIAFLLAAALGVSPALGGVDIDFGAAVRLDNDTDLFFSVSSRYFDQDRRSVESWGTRYGSDDLALALFIARHGNRSPDYIFSLRRTGLSWWEISVRLGVPADVWFVPVARDPGPPYGKAYGYWKKHKKHRQAIVLTDADLRNLVAVRFVHDYYGISVEAAMEWRSSGRDVETIVAAEYRRRHAHKGTHRTHVKQDGADDKENGKDKSKKKAGGKSRP